jgi:hypothetical protein
MAPPVRSRATSAHRGPREPASPSDRPSDCRYDLDDRRVQFLTAASARSYSSSPGRLDDARNKGRARPPLAPSPPASGASRLRPSPVSLSRRNSRLASPASVECYWERPRERHSRPQVAFLALGCHSVARFSDCLTSRLRQFAGAPRRWLRPEGGRCAAAPPVGVCGALPLNGCAESAEPLPPNGCTPMPTSGRKDRLPPND